jgi:hypothetical protein
MGRSAADLRGNLAAFAPELLFQLMALAHASGILTLRHGRSEVRILFEAGQLRFATGEVGAKARLGETLVRVGRLQPQQREAAVRAWRSAGGRKRLGTILVERGLLQRQELEALIREQIKSRIVEALQWRSGTFAFRRSDADHAEDIVLDMQLDHLLLECMTRLDQDSMPTGKNA